MELNKGAKEIIRAASLIGEYKGLTNENIPDFYANEFKAFVFIHSDEVSFNEVGTNRKIHINRKKPNVDTFAVNTYARNKTATANGTKDVIKITERIFIENRLEKVQWEIDFIKNANVPQDKLVIKEQLRIFKEYLSSRLNKINNTQQEAKTDAPTKKDFKNEVWFKVAVLFATGKMQKFYTLNDKKEFVIKPEYTAPKIANDKTINYPNYEKYILATLNNYGTKKNIFNRTSTELKEVIKYCVFKNYDVIPDIIERFNLIKDK